MPEDMRPDRCGAIVNLRGRWRGWKTLNAAPVGEKIPQETLSRLIAYAKERSLPIMFVEHSFKDGEYSETRNLATGPADFIAEAKHGINDDDMWKM
jgi:hypothetical protein